MSFLHSITLQNAFDEATSYGEYDKYVIEMQDMGREPMSIEQFKRFILLIKI